MTMKESDIRPEALFARFLELLRSDGEALLSERKLFVDVSCPACGSNELNASFLKEGFEYKSCQSCRSLFASPRPPPALLDSFYRDSKSVRFWATDFFKNTAEARREKMFLPRAKEVETLSRRYPQIVSGPLVDIGSGYGIFLEEVLRLKLFDSILGIEPARELASVCREKGFAVIESTAENAGEKNIHASVATAFEVLEHVFDPLSFFKGVAGVLRKGGYFLFTSPTVSGFDIQVLWEHSKSVSPPQHINLLSIEGIRRLVQRSGFTLIELSTPGRLDVDIVRNSIRENPGLTIPRFVQQIMDSGPESQADFQKFLQRNNLSSHIQVLARLD